MVTSADGGPVVDVSRGAELRRRHPSRPGETLRISVRRAGGGRTTHPAGRTAARHPASRHEKVVSGSNPFEGATVVNLSPAVAEELGLDPFGGKGVLISKIDGGAAQRVGLRRGDLIRSVNGRPIESVRDLTGAVAAVRAAVWQVTIERDGRQVTATFRA